MRNILLLVIGIGTLTIAGWYLVWQLNTNTTSTPPSNTPSPSVKPPEDQAITTTPSKEDADILLPEPSSPSIIVSNFQQQPETPSSCGIENCHGLDISCGPHVATICTEQYVMGDVCRQYAECGMVDDTCTHIINQQFMECKSCVKICLTLQPDQQLPCEQQCRNPSTRKIANPSPTHPA